MIATRLRLLVKTFRFELFAFTLACLLLAAGELFVTSQLNAVAIPKECDVSQVSAQQGFQVGPPDPATEVMYGDACQARQQAFYEVDQRAQLILTLGAILPVLAGIVIGVAVVGRELEAGTAALAWTMGRSRRTWYFNRALLLALVLGIVLSVPAFAAEILEHARQPTVDPWASFNDSGLRGPVPVLFGLLTYAIAVLAGAVIGRQLPALIVTLALMLLVLAGFETGVTRWQRSIAEWLPANSVTYSIDTVFDQEYRDRSTSEIVDQNTVLSAAPSTDNGPDGTWIDAHYESVTLAVPGRQYGLVVAAEAAVLGAASLLLIGVGLLVVNRRRPD